MTKTLLTLCLTATACATPQRSQKIESGLLFYSQQDGVITRGDLTDMLAAQPDTAAVLEENNFAVYDNLHLGFLLAGIAGVGASFALASTDNAAVTSAMRLGGVGLDIGSLVFLLIANSVIADAVEVHNAGVDRLGAPVELSLSALE